MASSFDGDDLFGSGPHRFQVGRQGFLVLPNDSAGSPTTTNLIYGQFELQVFVVGRLVGSTESALWSRRAAIESALDDLDIGVLVDSQGHSWSGMTLVRVEWGETVDRGRRVSVAYEARFLRFGSP